MIVRPIDSETGRSEHRSFTVALHSQPPAVLKRRNPLASAFNPVRTRSAMTRLPLFFLVALGLVGPLSARTPDGRQKLVLIAGKPSHPPRMHEFNAGVQLLAKCLAAVPGLKVEYVLNGWPENESIFDGADAVVFYMDGGKKHELVQGDGSRLAKTDGWTKRGVGIGAYAPSFHMLLSLSIASNRRTFL